MILALRIASTVFGLLAFRGIRCAYGTYLVLALLYFPAQVGFHFHPRACQLGISVDLALFSLGNWAHIVLFAMFYVMTMAQFRTRTWRAFVWTAVIVVTMGAIVEALEGVTGNHNCRLRDLVPDAAGAAIGVAVMVAWSGTRSFRSRIE